MPLTRSIEPTYELERCPFCGKVPMISHMTFARKDKQWEDSWRVSCSNNDCDVHPQTKTVYAKEIAVRIWNSRYADDDK